MADLRVGVVGATGLVGRTILRVLEERMLPVAHLVPLASPRSAGGRVPFAGREVPVRLLHPAEFEGLDVVFFSAGAAVSREYGPAAASAGAVVIDNSSAFRQSPDVPLVVPEVNGDVLDEAWRRSTGPLAGIVANPNCSTAQMVVALEPLHRAFGLESVVVTTYQSVSGTGAKGIRALEYELEHGERSPDSPYPHPIAFNALPQVDTLDPEGWSGEERKMMAETRKIMRLPRLHVVPTTVRVPVRVSHSEAVYARFTEPATPDEARAALGRAPGVVVVDDPSSSTYPLAIEAEDRDEVFVGRVRQDPDDDRALAFWVVADNLRKGAATNAVQIAEHLLAAGVLPAIGARI